MANLVTCTIEAPPDTIEIEVAFYDKTEEESLKKSGLSNIFNKLPCRITVPTPDFCAYYLYYKLRPHVPGFCNHAEVAKKWHQALFEFDGQVGFGDKSIHALSLEGTSNGTIEQLGEAVGLSVASNLHGLHHGDWARIPKGNKKTADFRRNIASDSVHIIELENKGSIATSIAMKSPSISNHKNSIKEKKQELRANASEKTVMYGTIAVLDDQTNSVARCWLVDPPSSALDDPRQFKILSRLEFIAELISLLGPRSTLAATLQTRMSSLSKLRDITPLDGVSLRRGNGDEFTYEVNNIDSHNPWFAGKTVVTDRSAGGQINMVRPDMMFFIGIREELVVYAAQQNFDEIAGYGFKSESLTKTLACVVPKVRFDSTFARYLDIPKIDLRKFGGYVGFQVPALLHYTRSGLVFGAAEVPDAWRK
jgi:hypothetical protein